MVDNEIGQTIARLNTELHDALGPFFVTVETLSAVAVFRAVQRRHIGSKVTVTLGSVKAATPERHRP